MRIALVVPGFSAHSHDWAIPALLNLARSLAQVHQVHVFSQRYPARGLYQFDGLTQHALGGGQRFGWASANIWLQTSRAILAQHHHTPFDLLHAFWADEAGFSACLAGARLKRPVVVSLGGGELARRPDLAYGAQRFLVRRLTTRYALRQAALVTAGSKYQLDLGRSQRVPEAKLRLAPLGVDTDRFTPAPAATKDTRSGSVWGPARPPLIGQAASLLPVKNQALLLEVLASVRAEIPEVRLNLAGTGPLATELVELAQKLKLSHNIRWHGHVPYPAMVNFYRLSHLYLQTSHHEAQGMAVLEAMASGLPVLGTPVGVTRDVACRPADWSKETLAAQVVQILSDNIEYRHLRQQARQTSEANFNVAVTAATFTSSYEEVTADRL